LESQRSNLRKEAKSGQDLAGMRVDPHVVLILEHADELRSRLMERCPNRDYIVEAMRWPEIPLRRRC
jgi:hypothetical protein